MRLIHEASRAVVFLILTLLTATSATYIPWNGRGPVGEVSSIPDQKSNSVGQEQSSTERRRHKSVFRNDAVRNIFITDKVDQIEPSDRRVCVCVCVCVCVRFRTITFELHNWVTSLQAMLRKLDQSRMRQLAHYSQLADAVRPPNSGCR